MVIDVAPFPSRRHSSIAPPNNKKMRARSAIALLGLIFGGTGIGFSFVVTNGHVFDLLTRNLSPSTIDAAISAMVAASSSLHVSQIHDAEPLIIGTPSIKEGTLGGEVDARFDARQEVSQK